MGKVRELRSAALASVHLNCGPRVLKMCTGSRTVAFRERRRALGKVVAGRDCPGCGAESPWETSDELCGGKKKKVSMRT